MSHLLSLIFFWQPETIKTFFHDLCEILKQKNDNPNKHGSKKYTQITGSKQDILDIVALYDSKDNQNLCFPFGNGWLHEVNNPIGQYLTLFTKYSNNPNSKYIGSSLYDLLKACRNLISHKFGNRPENIHEFSPKELELLDDLEDRVRVLLKHHFGIKYWTDKFPEFLLLTYEAGFNVKGTVNPNTQQNFGEEYFERISIPPPKGLKSFQEEFSKWIDDEQNAKSDMWLSQIALPEPNKKEILFLTIPQSSKLALKAREVITLTGIKDTSGNKMMQLDRNIVSPNDEEICKFELNSFRSKQFTSKYQNLSKSPKEGFQLTFPLSSTQKPFPFCVFTDVITVALAVCMNSEAYTKFTVFTHCSSKHIERKAKEFFKLRGTEPKYHVLSWNELGDKLKSKLLLENFPIHINSKFSINLSEIQKQNRYKFDDLCGGKLIGLIHYKSQGLLDANIHHKENYIKRSLLTVENKPIDEEELLTLVHTPTEKLVARKFKSKNKTQNKTACRKSLIIISDIAGKGKSTLLNYLGHLLISKNKLVKFITAKSFVQQIADNEESNCTDIWRALKNIWSRDDFEQNVVMYAMKFVNLEVSLLVDGLDELESDADKNRLLRGLKYFIKDDFFKSTIDIYITTKPHLGRYVKELDVPNTYLFKLSNFDDDDFIDFIIENWKDYRHSEDDLTQHKLIADKCAQSCQKLGQFADTPFACQMIAEVYQNYAINLKMPEDNIYSTSKMYEIFYDGLVREHVKKVIQRPGTQKHLLLDRLTINTDSDVFQCIKQISYILNTQLSLQSYKFGHETAVVQDLESIRALTLSNVNAEKPFVILADTYLETFGNFFFAQYFVNSLVSQKSPAIVKELEDFIQKRLFNIKNKKLENQSLLRFINSYLSNTPDIRLTIDRKNSEKVLFQCLVNKFDYIFASIVNGFEDYPDDSPTWSQDIQEIANVVDSLHIAVKNSDTKVINYLIKTAGLDVNIKHKRSRTALQLALFGKLKDQESVVRCLLENDADFAFKVPRKTSLFEMACAESDINDKIIRLMISCGNYEKLSTNWELWENKLKETRSKVFDEFQKLYLSRS